ncbi:MAG TPA: hypothetical protein PLB00_11210, partial [Pseudomonadota bacterium]|nr:hypothetical protein [Pseudomonadota bacterium]
AAYASAGLRLRLLEAEIKVAPAQAAARYREARGELARWPAYGRAGTLHAAAAQVLAGRDEALAADARAALARGAAKSPEESP